MHLILNYEFNKMQRCDWPESCHVCKVILRYDRQKVLEIRIVFCGANTALQKVVTPFYHLHKWYCCNVATLHWLC